MKRILTIFLLSFAFLLNAQYNFDAELILENNIKEARVKITSKLESEKDTIKTHHFEFGSCGKISEYYFNSDYRYQFVYDSLCNRIQSRSYIFRDQKSSSIFENEIQFHKDNKLLKPKIYFHYYVYENGKITHEKSRYQTDTTLIAYVYKYNKLGQIEKKISKRRFPRQLLEFYFDKESNLIKKIESHLDSTLTTAYRQFEFLYKYDKAGKLKRRSTRNKSTQKGNVIKYKYNDDGKLTERKFRYYYHSYIVTYSPFHYRSMKNKYKQKFYYNSKGLISEIEEFINNRLITSINIEYYP